MLPVDIKAYALVAHAWEFVGTVFEFLGHFGILATHEALDGVDGALGIERGLALGNLPHELLAGFCKCDYRRSDPSAFAVPYYGRRVSLHNSHYRISCPQINAYCFCHDLLLPS